MTKLPHIDFLGVAIALVALGLAVGIIAGLFFLEIPEGNREAAMLALGIVLGWGGTVVAWRFGSSHGSQRKTDMLADRPDGTHADPVAVEIER
jgi:hypothetical protein